MTAEQRATADERFDAIHELPPAERAAALSAIEDEEVRAEVVSLLAHAVEGETLTSVVGAMAAAINQVAGDAVPGKRLGPWRLLRRLGHGGQGSVFEAIRDDGAFRQRAAVKILNWEIDSDETRARFRQERQLLAGLEHPNIARLLDGGETPEGVPYLVMEFIDGLPLTAATQGWPTRRKLELFIEIAGAVAFAHRNLIVHRDLKPANILVSKDGVPKLLDFGIAKLLDSNAERTRTGLHALTPDYASPEQVTGGPITTACDVYSLGVVLYETLTGRRPYDVPTVSPVEIHKAVCLTEPDPPGISGDLDNILLMALRKEPRRRYASVEQFAEDVRRHLDRRPVLARRDSFAYRAGKFIHRNALALGAAAAILLAVAGGTIAALREARIAGQRFEQVRRLAHSFVFDYNDDLAKLEGATALREKMVRTALDYLDNLSRSAAGDIDLQKELAGAYEKIGSVQGFPTTANLGHADQAVASYRKAEEIHQRVAAADPAYKATLGRFHVDFADLLRLTGDGPGAIREGRLGLANLSDAAKNAPADDGLRFETSRAWCIVGDVDEDAGRIRPAYEEFRQCEAAARALAGSSRPHDALMQRQQALARLGTASQYSGRLKEALAAFDEQEKLLAQLLAAEPANPRLRRMSALLAQFRSEVYYDDNGPSLDDPAACLKYSREYLESVERLAARDPNDAGARTSLAIALFRLSFPLRRSDPEGAVKSARESVQIFDDLVAKGKGTFLVTSRRGRALRRLAEALLAANHPGEARDAASLALSQQRETLAHDPNDVSEKAILTLTLAVSARAADAAGDRAAALAFLAEAERVASQAYASAAPELLVAVPLAQVRSDLAEYWKRAGDSRQANEWAEQVRRLWREFPDKNEYVLSRLAASGQ